MILKIDNLIIAETHCDEFAETVELTKKAFWDLFQPGCDEHFLLQRLRDSSCYIPDLDFVAIEEGVIVGHAMATIAAVECVLPSAEANGTVTDGSCAEKVTVAVGVCADENAKDVGVCADAKEAAVGGVCAEAKEAAVGGVCADENARHVVV